MQKIKLVGTDYSINPNTKIRITEVIKHKFYRGFTVDDIFESMDISLDDYDLDYYNLYEEDISFEEYRSSDIGLGFFDFLNAVLLEKNKSEYSELDPSVPIEGEFPLWTMVYYDTDDEDDEYENNKEFPQQIENLKAIADNSELLEEIETNPIFYDGDVFYLIGMWTYMED